MLVFNKGSCECTSECKEPWSRNAADGTCTGWAPFTLPFLSLLLISLTHDTFATAVCNLSVKDCEGLGIGTEFSARECRCIPRQGGPTVPGITRAKTPEELQQECLAQEQDLSPVGSLSWLRARGLAQEQTVVSDRLLL